jgi:hypothetical protein
MRLKLILIVGVIATAIFVAGCGGGGDTTSEGTTAGGGDATTATGKAGSPTEPLTKTEFTTRINEICIQVPTNYERLVKELEKGGKKPSKAETNIKAAIPPLEEATEEMEAVTAPASKEAENLEEVVAALNSAVKGLEEKPTSELSGPKSPFVEFQKLTKEFGFETCSGL